VQTLSLGNHVHGDIRQNVRVELDGDRELADVLQGTGRHADLGLLHRDAGVLGERLRDVGVGDGAEEATVHTGLLRDVDLDAFELGALFLGVGKLLVGLALELRAAGLNVPRNKTMS